MDREELEDLKDQTNSWIMPSRMFSEENMARRIHGKALEWKLTQTAAALDFAVEKHAGQFRKGTGKVPYINHPLLITCHAMALGIREDSLLAACLLHDVCEDCGVSPEELPVGERARETVRLVTKWKPSGEENEEEKEARQQEYYRAISENRDAMIVKVLDRCNNISDMAGAFKYPKMAEYINETEQYVMPLLENLKDFYPELHDAAFLVKYQMRTVLTSLKRILYASASEKTL